MNTIPELLKHARELMTKAVENTRREFSGIRTGKATTSLLDIVRVDAYGSSMPLNQVALVAAPEARLLTVQPFDKGLSQAVEKAIRDSDLGLNPASQGGIIRVPIPTLTEERRKDLVKVVRGMVEQGRVAVRNVRHHSQDRLKHLEKEGQLTQDNLRRDTKRLQDMTDLNIKKLDDMLKVKEAEIMEV